MVFVVLSGLPLDVDPAHLAEAINICFGKNEEIGTFRINIDYSDIRKTKAVLKFKQGFDAMEAQRLLDNYKYVDPDDNFIYNVKAVVPTNDQPYQSLFREEVTDIADVILAEKHRVKKDKKAKKRKHSPIDKNLQVPKIKYKKEKNLERKSENSKTSTNHERSRSTTTNDSVSPRSSDSPKEIPKYYKRPCTADDTASSKSFDHRKVNTAKKEYRRPSESRNSDERKPQYRSENYNPERNRCDYRSSSRSERSEEEGLEDLRHKLERRSFVRTKQRDYESYYDYNRTLYSPSRRQTSRSEVGSRSDKEKHSSESTDSEYTTVPELLYGKKLLLLDPSHYLTENDVEFKEAVAHIISTVSTNIERLQDEDKKLILDNYTATVVNRLKHLNFTNLMSVQDIVLDYKLMYKTADDKLLINHLIKELQALGKGILLPEIKRTRFNHTIDEALETINIHELKEDVEYEEEDGEISEVINIVVNLVPIEKRELPFETDPDKVAEIKMFVSNLKKTNPSKFFRPIRSLLNEMKLFIYNVKVVPSEVILNRMVEVLEKILARMMEPIKTRVKSNDVCNLFRKSFPYKEDREFVDMIVKWIVDGKFDKGAVDGLIMEKIPKIEINKTTDEENSTNVHVLPASIKSEPQDTDTKPMLPVPIKVEIKTDNEDENHSEQTVTNMSKTVEQETKDVEIKREKQTNVVIENIDEDIIIKEEPFDVVLIEDDDLVTKMETIDDSIPATAKVKLETVTVSDSEDKGALSDDSRTTQIIETKPYFGNDQSME